MAKLKQSIETSPDYQVYLEQKNFIDDKITFQEAAGPVFGDVNSIASVI